MIRSTMRRAAKRLSQGPASELDRLRGVGSATSLPFDMFGTERSAKEAHSARKLEGIYHKGQSKAWDGKKTLAMLLDKHGGIRLADEERHALKQLFAVILWGELAAWKISADLAARLDPLEAKMAATSQVHDEARHFYVMHDYLDVLQEVPTELGPKTRAVLEGTLQAGSLTKKLMGMQMMIEPMALALFQIVRQRRIEPVLSELLGYFERDEARHVALGVLHLPKLIKGLSLAEASDLWAWEFREFWKQLAMIRELEPHFRTLGIDPRLVVEVGRAKQVRANKMLMEELGYELAVFPFFLRFFDAKAEWEFPRGIDRANYRARFRAAVAAAGVGNDEVPVDLTTAPA